MQYCGGQSCWEKTASIVLPQGRCGGDTERKRLREVLEICVGHGAEVEARSSKGSRPCSALPVLEMSWR